MTEQKTVLYIELLGGLRLRVADHLPPSELPSQQAGALLAVLALQLPQGFSREALIDRLWPEEPPEVGRHRLRNSLYALRRQFEALSLDADDLLPATRTTISLNPARVRTDVAQFEEALRAASQAVQPAERIALYEEAIRLYRGNLLPDFYLDVFNAQREHLARQAESALH